MSISRALNGTRQIAIDHLNGLVEELINCGIMTNPTKCLTGVLSEKIDLSRLH